MARSFKPDSKYDSWTPLIGRVLPANRRAAPGETGAERGEHEQIAAAEPVLVQGLVQRDGDRGGGPGPSTHNFSAWRPSAKTWVDRTPRLGSSVGPRITTPAPSPNSTAVSRPRVVLSRPREWISAPTSRMRLCCPMRIQASATDRP